MNMERLLIRSICMSAVVVWLLTSCKKQEHDLGTYQPITSGKLDTLRIYNLLPDISDKGKSDGYVLYLNDSLIPYKGANARNGVSFGVPPEVGLQGSGGSFTLKLAHYHYGYDTPVVKRPPDSLVLYQKTISVPAKSGTNMLVFYDDNKQPGSTYIPVATADPGAPAPGKFKIRVINFGYAMTDKGRTSPLNSAGKKYEVSMRYADSSDVPGNGHVAFGSMGKYYEMEYGTMKFQLYNLTDGRYINNSGPMNDLVRAFGLSPISTAWYPNNQLFPGLGSYFNPSTVQLQNIGSYPFAAGGCYTIMVIGDIYSVSLDRLYGAGQLDNFGKIQVVNANPNQQNITVNISYNGGSTDVPGLLFGQYSIPQTVPAGNVTITFSSKDQRLYTYNTQVFRLSNITCYYLSDLTGTSFVLPVGNIISDKDYTGDMAQIANVGVLNLSPDAGNMFFTVNTSQAPDQEIRMVDDDVAYKALTNNNRKSYDGIIWPPVRFAARLSNARTDTLAGRQIAALQPPFPALPAPGTYTIIAAGLLNAGNTPKGIKLFMIKHSNFNLKN